jgi:hypothetical protein
MPQKDNLPVIFLAFANEIGQKEIQGYLRELPKEVRHLREILEQAERDDLCELVIRTNATSQDIFSVFQSAEYRDRIAIFHYGGHANDYQLMLESADGEAHAADAGGLAAFFGQQKGLELVFLNGCSTQKQARGLLDANVSAVIRNKPGHRRCRGYAIRGAFLYRPCRWRHPARGVQRGGSRHYHRPWQ